jgi:hypothetical protein
MELKEWETEDGILILAVDSFRRRLWNGEIF